MGPKRSKSLPSNKKNNAKVVQPSIPKNNNAEKENFKFISQEYSKYLKCPLCQQLMIRPQRFHPCGHTFCFNCVGHLIDFSKKFCPLQTCLSKCQQIQKDRTAESLIDELKVACTNTGCQWKGEYDNYKKTHKESCPLKDMGLDKYLQELRRIPIRARSSIDLELKESQRLDQNQHMIQSEHLVRNDYEQEQDRKQNNFEQIKEQQSNQIEDIQQPYQHKQNSNQIVLQKRQVYDQIQEQQQIQQKYPESHQQKKEFNEEQKEKFQAVEIPQNFQRIQLEINHQRRIGNNSIILNIPFGTSFQARIQIQQRRRQNYISKQLKKLQ